MSASEMRIGDQTQVRLTVKDETDAVVDLSAAPTIHFIFRKPSGVKLTRTPSFETDGARLRWTSSMKRGCGRCRCMWSSPSGCAAARFTSLMCCKTFDCISERKTIEVCEQMCVVCETQCV